MVTGEPGSGKSTLGRRLSEALHVPYLSRDDVRWGLRASAGLWTNDVRTDAERADAERADAVEAFLQLVEKAAELGISRAGVHRLRRPARDLGAVERGRKRSGRPRNRC